MPPIDGGLYRSGIMTDGYAARGLQGADEKKMNYY